MKNIGIMKRITLYIVALGALAASCNPIRDDYGMGRDLTAEELDVSVRAEVINGKNTNKLIFENHSPILGQFDYTFGVTSQQVIDTAIIVVEGPVKVTFKGRNPSGSYVTKDFEVTVDELYYPVPEIWGLLCGSGTKTWEWNTDEDCFGAGGYCDTHEPWDPVDLSELDGGWWNQAGWGEGATMSFSIRGSGFSKTDVTGEKTETGTFSFDLSNPLKNIYNEDEIWSQGKLRILGGTSILAGRVPNYDTWEIYDVYEFEIVELTEDRLVLAHWMEPHVDWQSECYFWIFRAVE